MSMLARTRQSRARTRSVGRSRRPAHSAIDAGQSVALLALVFSALLLAPFSGTGGRRVAAALSPDSQPTDVPVLTLIPAPASGSAPFFVNVSVSVSGGHAPYNLSLCFGTMDHQSPPTNCGTGASNWAGLTPLEFGHLYTAPGNYSVTGIATDRTGAGVGSTALIVVTDRSVLNATVEERTTSGTAPLSVTFNESVAGGTPPITLQWTFGDGAAGSELPGVPIVHVFVSAGTFTPSLTVTDGAGHRTVRTLAPVTVAAPASGDHGFPGSSSGPSWLELGGAFTLSAVAVAILVPVLQRRRWRQEGNSLVAELEREAGASSGPIPKP
jgi:PKD repeat protein